MPKRKQNHIHLNGRHYDADTGEPLDGHLHRPAPPTPVIVHHPKPVHHAAHHAPRHPVNHAHAHAPEPAHTLMRRAVKKPGRQARLRAQGQVARTAMTVKPKASVERLDELRIRHAKHIRRSQLISHFSAGAVYPVPERPATKPARSQPRASAHHRKHATVHHRKSPTTGDILQKALEQATSFRELPVK